MAAASRLSLGAWDKNFCEPLPACKSGDTTCISTLVLEYCADDKTMKQKTCEFGCSDSKCLTKEEKEYIEESHRKEREIESKNKIDKIPWLSLFKIRKIWGLLIIKFLSDSAWFFFIFWLPKYLSDVRGLDIKGIGAYAWIPYAFAGVGSFVGGWLSSYLIKKGVSLLSLDHNFKINSFFGCSSNFSRKRAIKLISLFFVITCKIVEK